ncbi:LuxR C-terminal-related transcriptional regulator [Bradyrhizobium sp. USDA 4461]
MRWVAEGKSSWEIGMILEISENTVNFHIRKCDTKAGRHQPDPGDRPGNTPQCSLNSQLA